MEKERRETEKMTREKVVDTLNTWNKKKICFRIVLQCRLTFVMAL